MTPSDAPNDSRVVTVVLPLARLESEVYKVNTNVAKTEPVTDHLFRQGALQSNRPKRTANGTLHTRSTYRAVSWMNVATQTVLAGANSCRFLKMFGPEIKEVFHVANHAKSRQLNGDQWLFKCGAVRKDKMVVNVIDSVAGDAFQMKKFCPQNCKNNRTCVHTCTEPSAQRRLTIVCQSFDQCFQDVFFTWGSCYKLTFVLKSRTHGQFWNLLAGGGEVPKHEEMHHLVDYFILYSRKSGTPFTLTLDHAYNTAQKDNNLWTDVCCAWRNAACTV